MTDPTERDDLEDLEREGDPRGGAQSPAYRTADPRDLVVEEGVAMSGPAGAPQEREPEVREEDRDLPEGPAAERPS